MTRIEFFGYYYTLKSIITIYFESLKNLFKSKKVFDNVPIALYNEYQIYKKGDTYGIFIY